MVDADFSAAQAAEVLLGLISAGAIQRIGFLVVDPLDLEALMSVVPMTLPISVHYSPFGNPCANEGRSLAFGAENCRNEVPAAFPT
jgi:hypothetical protein